MGDGDQDKRDISTIDTINVKSIGCEAMNIYGGMNRDETNKKRANCDNTAPRNYIEKTLRSNTQ